MALKLILFCLLLKPAYASEPIKIGLTLGLTGKYAVMSDMQMNGLRLWEDHVNNEGGILGRNVRLVIYDDKGDPRIAKTLYEHLILMDKVDLVLGPYSSEITEAILPVTEQYGYPVLTTGASADRLWQKGYKYVFGVYAPASKYTTGFLELITANNFNNIAIVHADDVVSTNIAAGAKKWTERFGLKVVLIEGFKKGTKDLRHIAKKTKDSKADALIVCGHLDESIDMRLSLKNIGWQPRVYYASVGPATQDFHDRLGMDADYTFSSSQWEPHTKLPNSKKFTNSFIEKYKKMPSYHAATAYAAGQILETALKRSGNLDRNRLRDILSAMDTMTIIGRYGVDRTGMQIKHFNLIIQWQNGKKEVVWPEELRTAKPVFK
ncbi:MAG: amino acid ABC transporter substrate-binding protein [Thermodesulfovibrionales bacterium]|nr:amino acid ABC transporter substrate-binding protein [Thermodesulfovibrionales bacterium]